MTSPAARARLILLVCLAIPLAVAIGIYLRELPRWNERAWSGLVAQNSFGENELRIRVVQPGSPAAAAGIERGDRVLALDGIVTADLTALRLREIALRPGDSYTLTVARDEEQRDITMVAVSPLATRVTVIRLLVGAFCCFVFVTTGFFVAVAKPTDRRARVLAAMMLLYALTYLLTDVLMKSPMVTGRVSEHDIAALLLVVSTVAAFSVPVLFHFSLVFPKDRPALRRSNGPLVWAYAPATIAVLWMTPLVLIAFSGLRITETGEVPAILQALRRVVDGLVDVVRHPWIGVPVVVAILALPVLLVLDVIRGLRARGLSSLVHRPVSAIALATAALAAPGLVLLILAAMSGPGDPKLAVWGGALFSIAAFALYFGSFTLQLVATLTCLVLSYREAGAEERRQIRWPLWALIFSLGMSFVFGILTAVLSISLPAISTSIDIASKLVAIPIPIGFAFAIFRYRLMDVDLFMRRTVAYLALTGLVVAIYLAISAGLGALLISMAGVRGQAGTIVAALVAAAAFFPLRARVQGVVERTIFRERHDYPRTLERFSAAIDAETQAPRLAELAAEAIQRELPNKAVVVFAAGPGGDEMRAIAKVGDIADAKVRGLVIDAQGLPARLGHEPVDASAVPAQGGDAAAMSAVSAALLAVARGGSGRPRALITLGRRSNRELFEDIDREFVASVADRLGRRLDEIRLVAQSEDLERARMIQASLLPRALPRPVGLEVAVRYRPSQAVGGDYYDAIELASGKLALAIADVSGKGIAASLLMSNTQAAFRALAGTGLPPAALIAQLNRVLAGNVAEGRFVTFCYIEIDPRSGAMRVTNAGHTPPAILGRDGTVTTLATNGMPLGLFADAEYGESEAALAPGEFLFLSTDGITEAPDAAGTFFGDTGFDRRLAAAAEGAPSADEAARRLVDAVLEFAAGDPNDDVTLLVAKRD